jgi:hypothetical protein
VTLELINFYILIKNINFKKAIGISKKYVKNKVIFCLFFNSNISFFKNFFSSVVPFDLNDFSLKKFINIDFFFF